MIANQTHRYVAIMKKDAAQKDRAALHSALAPESGDSLGKFGGAGSLF
jgi:hypothetical protein